MDGLFGHWWIILIILVVVLIIWGPGKMPDVGAGMGRAIREFRSAMTDVHDTVVDATQMPPQPPPPPPPPPATNSAAPERPAATVPDDTRSR
jgi:sec-independent protein translocase protein TatA